MTIGEIIKNRRIELGLTLKEVSNALGTAESTISRYESNYIQNMGINKIVALSKILQCSPSYLLSGLNEYNTDKINDPKNHFMDIESAQKYLKAHSMIATFGSKEHYSDETLIKIANAIYVEKGENKLEED